MKAGRLGHPLLQFVLKGLVVSISFAVVFVVTYGLNRTYLRQVAETKTVITAKYMLLPGKPLVAGDLALTEKPVFGLGEDYAQDIDTLLLSGPWYIGELGLGAGDVLRPNRLRNAADTGGFMRWEMQRRDDVRLIAVETNLVRSSGNWLWPGTMVDAFVYLPAKDSYDDPQPARIIGPRDDPFLQALLVIDKRNNSGASLQEGSDASGESMETYNRDTIPTVVTLMVDIHDVERVKALISYNEEGEIYFSPTTVESPKGQY